MDYETLKIELRKSGYSMSMIAEALNCTPNNVQQICCGAHTSFRVATAVAAALQRDINEVFPATYEHARTFDTSRQERIDVLKQRLAG